VLRRDRQKGKHVKARDRLNCYAPIGAMLRDGGRYGIVRARLIGITARLGTTVMRATISVNTVPSGVRRAMRWLLESTVIAIMIMTLAGFYDCAAK